MENHGRESCRLSYGPKNKGRVFISARPGSRTKGSQSLLIMTGLGSSLSLSRTGSNLVGVESMRPVGAVDHCMEQPGVRNRRSNDYLTFQGCGFSRVGGQSAAPACFTPSPYLLLPSASTSSRIPKTAANESINSLFPCMSAFSFLRSSISFSLPTDYNPLVFGIQRVQEILSGDAGVSVS